MRHIAIIELLLLCGCCGRDCHGCLCRRTNRPVNGERIRAAILPILISHAGTAIALDDLVDDGRRHALIDIRNRVQTTNAVAVRVQRFRLCFGDALWVARWRCVIWCWRGGGGCLRWFIGIRYCVICVQTIVVVVVIQTCCVFCVKWNGIEKLKKNLKKSTNFFKVYNLFLKISKKFKSLQVFYKYYKNT